MTPSPFYTFGPDHLLALATLTGAGTLLIALGRRLGPSARAWIGRALGAWLLLYTVLAYTTAGLQGNLRWDESLPMHLCNWVLAACIVTLFRPNPLGFELAYFWGLGGTLQAVMTPDLREGFPAWRYFQFFWSHGGILLAITFMIAGLRLAPRPGSVRRMFVATNLYVLAAGTLDIIFGWNYGYFRGPPHSASLIDHLGPWPWYILSMEAVALASFVLLDLPWRWARRQRT